MRRPGNKKAAALLLLAAILAALLTGCGKDVSFEATSARAVKALAECESVHAEMSMDIEATAAILGEELGLDISAAVSMDTDGEAASGEVTIGAFGVTTTANYALAKSGDAWDLYLSSDGGESWTVEQGLDLAEVNDDVGGVGIDPDVGSILGVYLEFAGSVSDPVEETINGVECRRYDGTMPADKLAEAMGAADGLDTLPDGTVIKDAPVSIWFDAETDLPVRVSVDLSGAITGVSETGNDGSGITVEMKSLDSAVMTVELSRYGSAAPTIPQL